MASSPEAGAILASSPEAGAILASSPEAGAIVPEDHLLKYVLKPPGRRRTSSEAPPHGTKVHVNRDGYIKGTSRDGIKADMTSFFEVGGGGGSKQTDFKELKQKFFIQLIFPLPNIKLNNQILFKCDSRN